MATTPPPPTATGGDPEDGDRPDDEPGQAPPWVARLILGNGTIIESRTHAVPPIRGRRNAALGDDHLVDSLRFAAAHADDPLPPGWEERTVVETLCVLEGTTVSARGKMPLDAYVLELRRYALRAMGVATNPRRAVAVYGLVPAPIPGGEDRVVLDQRGTLLDAARRIARASRRHGWPVRAEDRRLVFEIAEQPGVLRPTADGDGVRQADRKTWIAETRAHLKAQGLISGPGAAETPPDDPDDDDA